MNYLNRMKKNHPFIFRKSEQFEARRTGNEVYCKVVQFHLCDILLKSKIITFLDPQSKTNKTFNSNQFQHIGELLDNVTRVKDKSK